MKNRLQNFEAAVASIAPFLPQYLESFGIDTSKNFKCLNPEHKDDSPSMTCKSIPEMAYCFGCKHTVNIFDAAHILEGKPKSGPGFIEDNLMYLANKFGVHVDVRELTQEQLYEIKTYKAYNIAHHLISDRTLGDYTFADKEIERRQWDKEKVASWGIGTVDCKELKRILKQHGFEPRFLAGVDLDNPHIFSEENLIFTVFDEYKRPVGFSAKSLNRTNNSPKYINTKQTGLECAIFKKSSRLYGFEIAKDIAQPLYIFEGQANVITARHYGLMNTCCTLGSHFSDNHVQLLKKTGNLDIVIVYDGDKAGEEATIKTLDERFKDERDFRIKIVQMPNGKDPDELIREKGIDAFLILKKWHAFDWRSNKVVQSLEKSDEPEEEKRKEIAESLVPLIVSEKNAFDQEEMAATVARITGYDKRTILEEVKRRQNIKIEEFNDRKINLIESHVRDIRSRPQDAEIIISNIQLGLDTLNKTYENEIDSLSTISILSNMKRKDEAKTGEFEGYVLDKLHDSLGKNLNGDWVGQLFYLAGSEQAGKCVKQDMLVLMADGTYKTIKDIVENKYTDIITMNQNHKLVNGKITNYFDSGILSCLKFSTKSGIFTEVSNTHPYYTLNGWKKASELNVGDKIAIARNYDCFDSRKTDTYISQDRAAILGLLLAEGGITDGSLDITNADKEIIDYFSLLLDKEFPGCVLVPRNKYRFYIRDDAKVNGNENRLKEWLKKIGVYGHLSTNKTVPDEIFKCGKKVVSSFLGAFWAGDGYITLEEETDRLVVGLGLANETLIKQIRSLLLRFGIKTKVDFQKAKCDGKEFDSWRFEIRDIENARKFYNNINIPLKRKQNILKEILLSKKCDTSIGAYGDNFPKEIWPYIKNKVEEKGKTLSWLFKLMGENKNPVRLRKDNNTFRVYPAWRPLANSRKHKGQEWLGITPEKLTLIGYILNDQFLTSLGEGDICFDEITSIEDIGKHQCYDITVEGTHNFIANDTIIHNSTLAVQMAVEIAENQKNNAMCIFHSIDDSGEDTLYKMLCLMDKTMTLKEAWIKNPKYHMGEHRDVFSIRDSAYKKMLGFAQQDRILVRDITNGNNLAYQESLMKKYREKYPDRNIIFFVDNFHCLHDFGAEQNTSDRIKKVSNYIKSMAVRYKATFICTAEYSKAAMVENSGSGRNSGLAGSRALQYDANVVLHLVNDLHINGEDKAKFVWVDNEGKLQPRIVCHIGKNKISGIEKKVFFDLHGAHRTLISVDRLQATEDLKERNSDMGLK